MRAPRLGGRLLAGRITALLGRPGPWTLPWIRRYLGWPQRGRRPEVPTPGKNRKVTVFGALEVTTGAWVYRLGRRCASDFIALLDQLLAAFPGAPVIAVICHNDHARKVTRYREERPRLELLYGARYSPHDNPVERIWAALKNYVANTAVTWPGRLRQIRSFFRARSPDEMLDTAAAWTSPWLPPGYEQNFWNAAFSTWLASVIKSAVVAFLPHLRGCAAVNDLKRTMLDMHLVDPLDDSPAGGTALPGIKVIAPFQQDLSFEFPDACRRREEIRFALRDVPRHVDTKVGDVDLSLATVRGLYDVGPDPLDYRVEAVVDRFLAKIPLDPLIEDLRHTAQLAGVDAPAPDAELVGDSLVILERLELAGELVRCR